MNENSVNILGEELVVDEGEKTYLYSLLSESGKETLDEMMTSDNLNMIIRADFAIHRDEEAWNLIEENLDKIDFTGLTMNCPFFRLKRDSWKTYDYLYEHMMIDDKTYAYFNCIGGEFHNPEFWTKYLSDAKSASDILDKIYDSFNGTNPLDLGLMAPCKEIFDLIDATIGDDEVIDDYVVGKKTSVLFPEGYIEKYYTEKHLSSKFFQMYIAIMFKQIDGIDGMEEHLRHYWKFVIDNNPTDCLSINDLPMMISYVKYAYDRPLTEENKTTMIITIANSYAFYTHPYLIKRLAAESEITLEFTFEDVVTAPERIGFVALARDLDFVYTDRYMVQYQFPGYVKFIFDKIDNKYYLYNGTSFTMDELVEKYPNLTSGKCDPSELNQEEYQLASECESEEDIRETALALNAFINRCSCTREYEGYSETESSNN